MSNGPGNYFYKSGAGGSGSGSGFGSINYITNFGAETDTTGWATYGDAAGNLPIDGTGGTSTSLTFSRSTSSPLISTASFSMAQANSTSLQGKGVSYDFTIDSAYQATNLSIQFNYNASSTFVTGDGITAPLNDGTTSTNAGNSDIEIFIYDVSSGLLIPVSPQVITGKGTNNFQFKGTFQTSATSTSYRLIFHIASTSANATGWTYKFDQVYVGPQISELGPPLGDWNSFTPTGSWVANSTYTGFWRRVGSNMEVQVNIALAGAPTTASLTVNMPTGYTIDTTRLTNSTASVGTLLSSGSGKSAGVNVELLIKYNTTTTVSVFYQSSILSAETAVDATHPGTFANGDAVNLLWTVPIVGWGSTTTMSNDTDTRVVGALYSGTPTGTLNGTLNTATFPTLVSDTHGAYAAGTYTVPVSGLYNVTAQSLITSTNVAGSSTAGASVFINGVEKYTWIEVAISTAVSEPKVSVNSVPLVAGDLVTIRFNSSGSSLSYTSNATRNFFSISRVSGPAAIAATDTVAAAYTDTAGSVISTTLQKYAYATKVFDTHSAYGHSGIYTIPISGRYQINAILGTAGTTMLIADTYGVGILQNNTLKFYSQVNGNGSGANGWFATPSGILSCVAGDTLCISAIKTTLGSTAINAAGENYFSIHRIGN